MRLRGAAEGALSACMRRSAPRVGRAYTRARARPPRERRVHATTTSAGLDSGGCDGARGSPGLRRGIPGGNVANETVRRPRTGAASRKGEDDPLQELLAAMQAVNAGDFSV